MSHPHANQVKAFLLELQQRICSGLEAADGFSLPAALPAFCQRTNGLCVMARE